MPWSCFYERCLGSRSGRSMEIFRLHSADRTNNSHCEWRQLFPPHRGRGVPESAMNPRAAHTNPRVNAGVEPRTRCALKIPCEFGHAYKTVVNNVFAYQFKMRDGSFPAWVWYVRATEPLYSLYHRLPMTCWLASLVLSSGSPSSDIESPLFTVSVARGQFVRARRYSCCSLLAKMLETVRAGSFV